MRNCLTGPTTLLGVGLLFSSCAGAWSIGCGIEHESRRSVEDDSASYRADVDHWRADHERSYRDEYVVLGGLFFLNPGANAAGSAASNDIILPERVPASIGTFVLSGDAVRFEPEQGTSVTIDGQPVTSPVALRDDNAEHPTEVTFGDLAMWVHVSGDRRAIRLRDPQSEPARSFAGFTWFPIDPSYRVVGRFIKDAEPKTIRVATLSGDYADYTSEGVVVFTLNGATTRLRPMKTGPAELFFVFRDGTSGRETYDAARFLDADLRDDGTAVLDFNEAYNPPCAFNPYTTCPIPPPENRLDIRILAGERAYAGGSR
jgi:uncharacterized protein (DUF1684 family)